MKHSSFRCLDSVLLRAILWTIPLSLIASSVAAQSADKIVKQATKAMGGEKALKRVTSCEFIGTITRQSDGVAGRYRMATAHPDRYFLEVELGGFEASEGYNGKSGWRRDSREGLRTLTGIESTDFRAKAHYRNHRWLDYKREKSKLAYKGQASVRGKPAQVVELITNRNVRIRMYFDLVSGLLLREELPSGQSTEVIEYADYRSVNDVMEPFALTIIHGQERFEVALEKITYHQPLDRALFDFPKISDKPLPDIPALLKQVAGNQDHLEQLLENYTYTEVITRREFDKNGVLKEKESVTYDVTFYRGRRLRRLTAKNGRPLSPDDQAKEDRRLEKVIREIEKRETEKNQKERHHKPGPPDETEKRPTIAEVLRASQLVNPRYERFRGRECVVFDFEPLPGYKPKETVEKLMGKIVGAVWIDAADRQVARVEARLIDSFKIGGGLLGAIRSGAAFVLEQDRINNEVWLPSYAEFNLSARALFIGFSLNQTIKYGDYQRFQVETEKERLKPPIPEGNSVKP